jgi:DNA-binding XRE family transcriptional regulator
MAHVKPWWKEQIAVDTSGNHIEVLTIQQAAYYLRITKSELKLQLYRQKCIPYYKVFSKAGSKVIRLKKKDLDDFVLDNKMFDRIADRIVQAREEHVHLVTGLGQTELSRQAGVIREHLNRIENHKARIGLKALKRISAVLGKPVTWFLD